MVYAQLESVLENDTHKLLWDFDIHMDHLIWATRPDLIIINKIIKEKKRNSKIVDFAVQVDHRIKLKEYDKKNRYLDLARELKKIWNIKITTIPNVIGAFGTITKGIIKRTGWLGSWRKMGDYPNLKHYWELPKYWEDAWSLEENCCHLNSIERPSDDTNE